MKKILISLSLIFAVPLWCGWLSKSLKTGVAAAGLAAVSYTGYTQYKDRKFMAENPEFKDWESLRRFDAHYSNLSVKESKEKFLSAKRRGKEWLDEHRNEKNVDNLSHHWVSTPSERKQYTLWVQFLKSHLAQLAEQGYTIPYADNLFVRITSSPSSPLEPPFLWYDDLLPYVDIVNRQLTIDVPEDLGFEMSLNRALGRAYFIRHYCPLSYGIRDKDDCNNFASIFSLKTSSSGAIVQNLIFYKTLLTYAKPGNDWVYIQNTPYCSVTYLTSHIEAFEKELSIRDIRIEYSKK